MALIADNYTGRQVRMDVFRDVSVFDAVVQLNAAAAASFPVVTLTDPMAVLTAQIRLVDQISATTAVKVGLRDTSGADHFVLTPDLLVGSEGRAVPWGSDALQLDQWTSHPFVLYAAASNGDAVGTIGGGTPTNQRVRVRIIYIAAKDLGTI